MSTIGKLIERFLSKPRDFSYKELKRVLLHFGYYEKQCSGSRVIFYNNEIDHSIKLHKPHPRPQLKRYQLELIIGELSKKNLI